jgi:hypothetical protein
MPEGEEGQIEAALMEQCLDILAEPQLFIWCAIFEAQA